MPIEFSHTLRSIRLSGPAARVKGALAVLLLGAVWVAWFFFSRTYVYAKSVRARVVVSRDVYVVQSAVAGVVTETHLALGKEVKKGDVLVVLDSRAQALELDTEQARLEAAKRRRDSIDREIKIRMEALKTFREAKSRGVDAVRGKMWATAVDRKYAAKENAMIDSLAKEKIVSGLDAMRSEAAAERQKAALGAAWLQTRSAKASAVATENDRQAELAELKVEETDAESEVQVREANCKSLAYAIKSRTIRAATSGTLADVTLITPGATLAANQAIASIVPRSKYRVVAYFPATIVGRMRPGQRATVRLDAFPWIQYGALHATVSEVASEANDGLVRSELTITRHDARISLSHGLTGSVEVETEAVSPAALVLRTAGYWIVPQSQQARPAPAASGQARSTPG